MRFGRLAATLGAAVMAAVFVGAVPAHAADSNVRLKNQGMGDCVSSNGANSRAIRAGCTTSNTRWRYQPRGTSPSGHTLVKLQSMSNGGCLDTLGGGWGGTVYTHSCNTGNNQLWEVFPVALDGRTFYVYKSWGAFTGRNLHLCLFAWANPDVENLEKCDTGSSFQRWTKSSV